MYTVYTLTLIPLDITLNRKVIDGTQIDAPIGKKVKTYKTYLGAYDRMADEQYKNTENTQIYVLEDSSNIIMNVCNGLK